jgi:disulfide bond formation protein DsbB
MKVNQVWIGFPRWSNFGGAILCVGFVVVALWLEWVQGMEPCPLCIFQRLAFLVMALGLLWGAWRPGYVAAIGVGVGAIAGVALAARHLWLQSLPADQVPACGPGLGYLMNTLPLTDVLSRVLSGSGECAEVDYVLGLSIPLWTLLAFVGLGVWFVGTNVLAGRARRR